jgi:hypothetical protein
MLIISVAALVLRFVAQQTGTVAGSPKLGYASLYAVVLRSTRGAHEQ